MHVRVSDSVNRERLRGSCMFWEPEMSSVGETLDPRRLKAMERREMLPDFCLTWNLVFFLP